MVAPLRGAVSTEAVGEQTRYCTLDHEVTTDLVVCSLFRSVHGRIRNVLSSRGRVVRAPADEQGRAYREMVDGREGGEQRRGSHANDHT